MKKGIVPKNYRLGKRAVTVVIFFLIVMVLSAVFLVLRHSAQDKYEQRLAEKQKLILEIAREHERTATIEEYRAYVQTRGYLEEIARERLGLVYGDEIIFRPGDITPTATPTPAP